MLRGESPSDDDSFTFGPASTALIESPSGFFSLTSSISIGSTLIDLPPVFSSLLSREFHQILTS